jgi:hypothetical protein
MYPPARISNGHEESPRDLRPLRQAPDGPPDEFVAVVQLPGGLTKIWVHLYSHAPYAGFTRLGHRRLRTERTRCHGRKAPSFAMSQGDHVDTSALRCRSRHQPLAGPIRWPLVSTRGPPQLPPPGTLDRNYPTPEHPFSARTSPPELVANLAAACIHDLDAIQQQEFTGTIGVIHPRSRADRRS